MQNFATLFLFKQKSYFDTTIRSSNNNSSNMARPIPNKTLNNTTQDTTFLAHHPRQSPKPHIEAHWSQSGRESGTYRRGSREGGHAPKHGPNERAQKKKKNRELRRRAASSTELWEKTGWQGLGEGIEIGGGGGDGNPRKVRKSEILGTMGRVCGLYPAKNGGDDDTNVRSGGSGERRRFS